MSSYATFPGLAISRADMVFSHGVTPSVCHVVAVPEESYTASGDLVFYDEGVPVLTFSGCAIDRAWDSPPYVKRGQRCNLRILDRRWKWKGARISGRYNRRQTDSNPTPDTKKTYTELVEILLDSLGENSRDINIPCGDKNGPTVEWECARADLELAQILESVGCVIVLGLDNWVKIVPIGQGDVYPANGLERIPTQHIYPATRPWKVRVDFGPTRYQSKLQLEAVGLDVTGQVLPINELSYAPSGGWWKEVPGVYDGVSDDDSRAMARETVYKWYRVKSQADGSMDLPGGVDTIETIDDILPLYDDLVMPTSMPNPAGSIEIENFPPDKANISGYFFDGDMKGVNENEEEYSRWDDRFILDKERGIVKFDEYMFHVNTDGHSDQAVIFLECSYHARGNAYSGRWHYEVDLETGVGKEETAGVAITSRHDLFKWAVQTYGYETEGSEGPYPSPPGRIIYPQVPDSSEVYTNEQSLFEHGESIANSFLNTFLDAPQNDQQWSGIIPYDISGNVFQMRWVVGNGAAMTYGSRSSEVAHFGPTYRERRIREEVDRRLFP